MSRTNCLNCGSPFDVDKEICPYCGTNYFDMSAIDLNGEPFMLKIKTLLNGRECYITELVRALPSMEIAFNSDTIGYKGNSEKTTSSFTTGQSVSTNITFEAIPRKSGALVYLKMTEDK